jgi:hypothetical protein
MTKIEAQIVLDQVNKIKEETQGYIDDFYKTLENCETEEGRDKLRLAQVYINTVNINTEQNNTVFIAGLADLLSGTKVCPLKKLHKINQDIDKTIHETTMGYYGLQAFAETKPGCRPKRR